MAKGEGEGGILCACVHRCHSIIKMGGGVAEGCSSTRKLLWLMFGLGKKYIPKLESSRGVNIRQNRTKIR